VHSPFWIDRRVGRRCADAAVSLSSVVAVRRRFPGDRCRPKMVGEALEQPLMTPLVNRPDGSEDSICR
jgi:hypothetical protein